MNKKKGYDRKNTENYNQTKATIILHTAPHIDCKASLLDFMLGAGSDC
ncbi:MAG: hypothetical protein JW732_02960 [Dehalococcoidia bacterium]|nr:hypothetical protein [Dehalococcoidia bacterium]